jgi:hypothetical protein
MHVRNFIEDLSSNSNFNYHITSKSTHHDQITQNQAKLTEKEELASDVEYDADEAMAKFRLLLPD